MTEQDCRHKADALDPTAPGDGAHLPFHQILQRCGLAWRAFLAEVRVGTLDIDVSLVRIGTSSFTVVCAVSQDGVPGASVEVVLVCFDYETRSPLPLSETRRGRLEELLV